MSLYRHILRSRVTIFNAQKPGFAHIYNLHRIGRREVVGHGLTGSTTYVDSIVCPMPAIRYKEFRPEHEPLRTKERGDWKELTIDDRKTLYRISFRHTFAEMQAPTGVWKMCFGAMFIAVGISLTIYGLIYTYVYDDLPESFNDDHKKAQLVRQLILMVDPIDGLSSRFNYDDWQWK